MHSSCPASAAAGEALPPGGGQGGPKPTTDMRLLVALAIPMIVGQAMQVGLHAIDAVMVTRLGVDSLVAAAMGNNAAALFYFIGVGFGSTVPVLAARAFGAGDRSRLNLVLRHGLTVSLFYSVACVAVFVVLVNRILPLFGPAEFAEAARPYAVLLIVSLVPALLLQNLRGFAEAQNRPWLPLANIGVGVGLNVVLNLGFIYGKWGFPALGLTGAALGTLLARCGMLAHFVWVLRRERTIAPAPGAWRWVAPRRGFYGEYFRVAVPSAVIAIVLIGNMVVVTAMMGQLGAVALAANEITRQLALLAMTVPLGLSWAIAIRVGQAAGRAEPREFRSTVQASLATAGTAAAVTGAAIFFGRRELAQLFLGEGGGVRSEVLATAEQVLAVAAGSVVADAVVLGCLGVFRGMAAVRAPAAIYAAGLWCVALPLAYGFGHWRGGGAVGVWTGLVVGNLLTATTLAGILAWRLSTWRPNPRLNVA